MKDLEASDHLEMLRLQTVLARFGELALRSNDLDEILTEACRLIGDALGTDLAKVMELQRDGETLLVRAGVGWQPGIVGKIIIPVKDDTSESYALKTGQPVISPDIGKETRFRYPSFLTDHGVQAVANVLIIGVHGKPPFGILQIDSRQPRSFDDNDTTFLRSYANLLAAAVDRLRTLEEARDQRERLRLALDAGELGSWELDLASGVMTCSPRYYMIFGYADQEPVWSLDILLTHVVPEDRERVAGAFQRTIHAGAELRCECRIGRVSHGDVCWIEIRGRLVLNGNHSQADQLLGIIADITMRKVSEDLLRRTNEVLEARVAERTQALSEMNARLRAEAAEREQVEDALRQSQKMEAVGQLTGGIAHDFNNMLHAIGGNLELMSRRVEQGRAEEAASMVDEARQTVERAALLTNRLLAFARQYTLQPRRIEPDALMHGIVDMIQRTVGPAIVVEERLRDGFWPVLCDPNQLETALLNVAINARDAMPDGGKLTIATRDVRLSALDIAGQEGASPGDYVEIAIADTGTGMDEAVRSRAFEPFFTTKPVGKGTGLGLSQLYGFIRQSKGVVQLDSARGQGTTVRLYLPRHDPEGTEQAPLTANTPRETGVENTTVMLVDDDVEMRTVVMEALRQMRCHVLEASDSATARQILNSDLPGIDLLVTELDLPGDINGRQLADVAWATRPALPVLLMTADIGGLESWLAPGMKVIAKPFTLSMFAMEIRSMIERAPEAAAG